MSEEQKKWESIDNWTTIQIHKETRDKLRARFMGIRDRYNNVIERLLEGITDVFVGFVLIDDELPFSHNLVFQLGDKQPPSLYYFNGHESIPINEEDTQKRLKNPKAYLSFTRDEVKLLHKGSITPTPENQMVLKKIEDFLDDSEKEA